MDKRTVAWALLGVALAIFCAAAAVACAGAVSTAPSQPDPACLVKLFVCVQP